MPAGESVYAGICAARTADRKQGGRQRGHPWGAGDVDQGEQAPAQRAAPSERHLQSAPAGEQDALCMYALVLHHPFVIIEQAVSLHVGLILYSCLRSRNAGGR